jgi:hypothetical protein
VHRAQKTQGRPSPSPAPPPAHLGQVLLRGKAQAIDGVGATVRPLPELLGGFGEGHVGGDSAVDDGLRRGQSLTLITAEIGMDKATLPVGLRVPAGSEGPAQKGSACHRGRDQLQACPPSAPPPLVPTPHLPAPSPFQTLAPPILMIR